MENYPNPHSATQQTDAYGNPIPSGQKAETFQSGLATGHEQGKLHRSGSSSSSSSEDDGQGGRRKKGIGQKIKEKLPGAHKDQHTSQTTTTTEHHPVGEKKGMMDKIKEKFPGGHSDQPKY